MSYPNNRMYKVISTNITMALSKFMEGITIYRLNENTACTIIFDFNDAIDHVKNGGEIGYFVPYDYVYVLTKEDVACVLIEMDREDILKDEVKLNNLVNDIHENFYIEDWMGIMAHYIEIWERNYNKR